MNAVRGMFLLLALTALFAVAGCTVSAGPGPGIRAGVVVPPPPPCPVGYYWSPGYGCLPLPPGAVVPPGASYAVVNRDYLSLRSCASTKCGIIDSLSLGEQVQVLGYEGGWTHVWAYARGKDGWVASRYLN